MTYRFENVFVAGRRVDGSAEGESEDVALRAFVARQARVFKVDVATSIAQARNDKLKRVFITAVPIAKPNEPLRGQRQFMAMLDTSPFVEWPSMLR